MAKKHATEAAYDDRMAPLITQLIQIAKAEGLGLFVHATMLEADGSEPMGCITVIPSTREALKAFGNRHQLARVLCTDHNRSLDHARSLRVTSFHPVREVPCGEA
jgi:hypothetical protein